MRKDQRDLIDSGRFINLGRFGNLIFQGAASPSAYKQGMGEFNSGEYNHELIPQGGKDLFLAIISVGLHFTPFMPIAPILTLKKLGDLGYDSIQAARTGLNGRRTP